MFSLPPLTCRAQSNASLQLNVYEHLGSHDACKTCHREGYITQTTNIIRIHVIVLSHHIVWHDLLI